MSWFTRLFTRVRPTATSNRPGEWDDFWYEQASQAKTLGITEDKAMALSAFFACIRNISEDLAKIPLTIYRRSGDKHEAQPEHRLWRMLNESANEMSSAMTVREMLLHWAIGWGNGYAEMTPAPGGWELWPIHPRQVDIVTEDGGRYYYYNVREEGWNVTRTLMPDQMFHIRGLGSNLKGYSIVQFAAESMNRGLAAQQFSRNFFARGASLSGVLEHPGKLDEAGALRIARSWHRAYGGSENTGKTAVLEEGMKFNKLSISPEDGQMLETMEFSVVDVARWFRMPPHKIQAYQRAQGWSTLEAANTDYVTDTLMSWAKRFELEVKRKLLSSERYTYVEHDFDDLKRGDMAARATFYRTMREVGAYSVNEIRSNEGMSPLGPEGDTYIEPMNMKPLGEPNPEPQPMEPPELPQDEDEDEEPRPGALDDAFDVMVHDVAQRIAIREMRVMQRYEGRLREERCTLDEYKRLVETFYEKHAEFAERAVEPLEQAWRSLGRNSEAGISSILKALAEACARLSANPAACESFYETREDELYKALRRGFYNANA